MPEGTPRAALGEHNRVCVEKKLLSVAVNGEINISRSTTNDRESVKSRKKSLSAPFDCTVARCTETCLLKTTDNSLQSK